MTYARIALLFLISTSAFGQANGHLQLHFISVGQGDAALLVSPAGETVLFDDGKRTLCDLPVTYLLGLGVDHIDYHIASHYHDDHIGCTSEVLATFPLTIAAYDRGGTYRSDTFTRYRDSVGTKRRTARPGETFTLDATTSHPVRITFVVVDGNGASLKDENDRSIVAVVHFDRFVAEFGGDLSGENTKKYADMETGIARMVGPIAVYKVHHHGSRYSTNRAWLAATHPTIAVISVGDDNDYEHPTLECLNRLHDADVRTYWTSEGGGAPPEGDWDEIAGNTVVDVPPAAALFTVTTEDGRTDRYPIPGGGATPVPRYAWSERARLYHRATCPMLTRVAPDNLRRSDTPPPGKQAHDCAR